MHKERMIEVLDKIRANPETFNMAYWAYMSDCGTTYCLAGHAALLAGWEPAFEYFDADMCTKDNQRSFIFTVAAEHLGLTALEAARIFFKAVKTVDDLIQVIEHETGEKLYV